MYTDLSDFDAILIAGPTASGKSALAVRLAKDHDGEVINADSMQVYNGLAILSARPDEAEMAGVPHHLFGHVPAETAYSVGDYVRNIAPLLENLRSRGKKAFIVGGTGLYFRALTDGLVRTPDVLPEVRARLETAHAAGENVHARLTIIDPNAAARLNPSDTPRILRALEVIESTGRPLSAWQANAQGPALLPTGSWKGIFLHPERSELTMRIDARFVAMIERGALAEVRAIMTLGLPANRGIMKAHGVPHLFAHLEGQMSLEDAIVRGQQDTRRYAKRQVTWARKFMTDWNWINI